MDTSLLMRPQDSDCGRSDERGGLDAGEIIQQSNALVEGISSKEDDPRNSLPNAEKPGMDEKEYPLP
jgi:hypothetical protein